MEGLPAAGELLVSGDRLADWSLKLRAYVLAGHRLLRSIPSNGFQPEYEPRNEHSGRRAGSNPFEPVPEWLAAAGQRQSRSPDRHRNDDQFHQLQFQVTVC